MKTILSALGPGRMTALIASAVLGALAFFLKFCVPGYSFSALVCLGLIALILFYAFAPMVLARWPRARKIVMICFTVVLIIGLILFAITETVIIRASFGDPGESCQYMVVLGAKVRTDGPSVSLWDRILGARDYMLAHPEVIAIVSGGQGPDEPMTEAQCMFDSLVALGIDPDRIWLEGSSTSTRENLTFSLDLIEERTGVRPQTIGVLSSEYHLFRAGLYARSCGVEAVGIPARTSRPSQLVNHFLREVAGVWYYILLGGQYD